MERTQTSVQHREEGHHCRYQASREPVVVWTFQGEREKRVENTTTSLRINIHVLEVAEMAVLTVSEISAILGGGKIGAAWAE